MERVYELAGRRTRLFAAGATTLRLFGLVKPAMREYLHTLYQFTDRWVVDDSQFRAAFGTPTTSLDDALATTLEWYAAARDADEGDHPMNTTTTRRLAAAAMTSAALLAIAGFTALGSVFDYPQILQEPTDDILALYREHATAVSGWFLVLVVSAALLAPAGHPARPPRRRPARPLDRRSSASPPPPSRSSACPAGCCSSPASARTAAPTPGTRFELLHTWLGVALGETVGYALTATFTVLVLVGLGRAGAPRWLVWLGYASAALIATGVVIPLGVEVADLTNFAGYVGWCLWLIALSVVLWRQPAVVAAASTAVR